MSVQVYDDYWQKIQELFAKERQWMTTQMQGHIREVNYMFADERKSVNVTRNMMVAISILCQQSPINLRRVGPYRHISIVFLIYWANGVS